MNLKCPCPFCQTTNGWGTCKKNKQKKKKFFFFFLLLPNRNLISTVALWGLAGGHELVFLHGVWRKEECHVLGWESSHLYIYLEATLSNSTFTSLVHFYGFDSLLIKTNGNLSIVFSWFWLRTSWCLTVISRSWKIWTSKSWYIMVFCNACVLIIYIYLIIYTCILCMYIYTVYI